MTPPGQGMQVRDSVSDIEKIKLPYQDIASWDYNYLFTDFFSLKSTGDGCNIVDCHCNIDPDWIDPKTKEKYGTMMCMQTMKGCVRIKDVDDLKK